MNKLVYSFWSAPLYKRWNPYKDKIDVDNLLVYAIRCLFLSVLYAHRNGFEIEIVTDTESEHYFKKLPFLKISTALSFLNYEENWLEGKLLAISKQTKPFVYLDWDIMLKKEGIAEILRNFNKDVLIQNFEHAEGKEEQADSESITLDKIIRIQHLMDFGPHVVDGFHQPNSVFCNTSVLGFNNLRIRDIYVNNFLKATSVIRKSHFKGYSKFTDQYVLAGVLEHTQATCKALFHNKKEILTRADEIGYTHLTFLNKFLKGTQQKIKAAIKNEFSEYRFLVEEKVRSQKLKISLCTVVMNRIDHFVVTLKSNIEVVKSYNGQIDINILDYNSTDGLQEYLFEQDWFLDALNKNYISYYKNYDAKYYHRTLPKNCIHFLAGGTYLINIDADNFIDYSYIDFCLDIVKNKRNFFLRPHINNTSGAFGRIMMHHNDFKKIQGYNLAISRYGFEDSEITLRLRKLGIQQLQTPKDMLLQFIGHSDNLRLSKEAPIDVVKANCIYQSEFSNRTLKPLSGEESKKMYDLKIYQLDQKQARVRINIGGLVPIKI